MHFDPIAFDVRQGVSQWLQVVGFALLLIVIVSLGTSLGFGVRGFKAVLRQMYEGVRDFADLSFRRIWAIASLTIREAVRRKAFLVFVVFAVLFMFGSWFLTTPGEKADIQIERHVVFVFTAISWLVLPVALMLSCWGIPEDIKARSIHTVVTKPARRLELVIGRMLGFTLVTTSIVALMGIAGYVWIDRQIPQSAHDRLVCKVPVYGKLSFIDRQGEQSQTGINVGDIWMFRSYIEGATKATAIWDFENINASSLVPVVPKDSDQPTDGLRIQTNFESFRTHKGIIDNGLLCELTLVNPDKKLRVPVSVFEVAEYRGDANQTVVPRKIEYRDNETKQEKTVDLIDDVVSNGNLRVEARCLNGEQFLGMARPDLFLRMSDRPFAVGYFKAVVGLWLEAVLVVMLGVTASCFLKGPIATLLTFAVLIVGQGFHELVTNIVGGKALGGGPMESIYRMVTHMNQTVDMELSKGVTGVIKGSDWVVEQGLFLVQQTFPNFTYFGMSPYVAKGFDVDFWAAMVPSIAVTLAYILPCILLGYYSLKLRELESK